MIWGDLENNETHIAWLLMKLLYLRSAIFYHKWADLSIKRGWLPNYHQAREVKKYYTELSTNDMRRLGAQ